MQKIILWGLICLGFHSLFGQTQPFYAYYTKIEQGKSFEKFSRTGEYADVVVQLGEEQQLQFWRGTSYLPVWKTPKGEWKLEELVARKGNGTSEMPDATNMFSHVRIVKTTADTLIIMWRYLPKFAMNPYPHYPLKANPLEFTEELFTITQNGMVERIICQGTPKINDWQNNNGAIVQILQLKPDGIKYNSKRTNTEKSDEPLVTKARIVTHNPIAPVYALPFNEGTGNSTIDLISQKSCEIKGHKALWKQGVSGTSLQFDGYTSQIKAPFNANQNMNASLGIEAWVCSAAYPWNWVPIAQLGDSAYFALGLNDRGYPEIRWTDGNTIQHLIGTRGLNRNRWYNLSATFNSVSGMVLLYINGYKSDSIFTSNVIIDKGGLTIARMDKMGIASDPVRPMFNFPTLFGFDGLIDEVRIYNQFLTADHALNQFKAYFPGESVSFIPDIEIRKLPQMERKQKFEAVYTQLKYYETWDNMWRFGAYTDVVVGFENSPVQFMFWKGTNYVPCIVNDMEQWVCNEFNETWGTGGGKGCQEPMSDKQLLTAHARIIEQSEARVVVHWRLALLDTKLNILANYDTVSGWGDWSDWYYYIYPDGVAAKKMQLWTSGQPNHEWQETMVIVGENTRPEEVLEQSPVYSFIDTAGNISNYNWIDAFKSEINYNKMQVFSCNFKSDWDPFTIGQFTGGNVFRGEEITPYSVFCNWNHWPTALINCDGRFSSHPDRASHTSLNNLFTDFVNQQQGSAPFYEKILLEGISNKSKSELFTLSASWLNAPEIATTSGVAKAQYDKAQRAYIIDAEKPEFSFTLSASTQKPLLNPAFVINLSELKGKFNIDANDKNVTQKTKQGIVRNSKGQKMLVIWLEMESMSSVSFQFKPN